MKKNKKNTLLLMITFILTFILAVSNNSFAGKPDRIPPTAPSNLTAASVFQTSAALTWQASTDNIAVKRYEIYKNNVYFASTISTSYTVNNLVPSTAYKFYIKAVDARGNRSASSNVITVTTASSNTSSDSGSKIVGYYAAWAAYSGYKPDQIDASKLTHINYAFANIGPDLKLTLGYPDIDPSNFQLLNSLKQVNPELKTLISVGGWTWSGRFSDAALTDSSRTIFADSCIAFMKKYGFDGIDIDWEYPVSGGLSTNSKRPEDKQNFTLLLQKLRERLDAQGEIDQKHYLLTIAGGAGSSYPNNVQLSSLHQYLDYATIMTYDLHGTWDAYTDLHAPLYQNSDVSPQYKESVDSSIHSWEQAGFPMEKLVMGIPFYGYLYSSVPNNNHGLYQSFHGSNSISYGKISASYLNQPGYTRYFHSQSMVPWLFNGSTFISYEDPASIQFKTEYIKTKGLGGAMVWELSQDPDKILLNSLFDGLQ